MSEPRRFRKKPVEIEAIQWGGEDFYSLMTFTEGNFKMAYPGRTPGITAEVWDMLHSTWVGVKTGDWIIKGVKGEFYPCDDEVFHGTYEEA